MKTFPTKRTKATQNFPFPDNGQVVFENPPVFIWIPVDEAKKYTVKIYDDEKKLVETIYSDANYATPKTVLEAKDYYWSVETDTGLVREMYRFTVAENALLFERPTAREVFESVPDVRPRHLFGASDIERLKSERKRELKTLKNNVKMALERGSLQKPMFDTDPKALPYREYFGLYRDICDRDLVALSLWYALTDDIEAGSKAKEMLLEICSWDPDGECSVMGKSGDEIGLSNARCLPSVFDLLYDLLDENEKNIASHTVCSYAKQCKERIEKINYIQNPADSHVGRLPGYLGEAALVLKGTGAESDEVLISWLECALDIYGGIFPYYGSDDGSWAEGAFYSASYTKWYLPFFSAVERYTGKSLMNRPFYHRFTNYLIHFCNPSHEIYPFGDGYWAGPESDEFPGFFAQNPYRIYADKFGPDIAKKRADILSEQEYFKLHLLDLFLPADAISNSLAKEPENVEIFPEGGFAALHTDLNSENDICVLARASRFGSDSHRHADQGSFALFCGGVCLVSPSGYFGRRYGTKHHLEWTNSTLAHNALVFDGVGQPTFSMKSIGKIVSFDKENKSILLDMSDAYENIDLWQREIRLFDKSVEIVDRVKAKNAVNVTYPMHFLSRPHIKDEQLFLERSGKKLTVTVAEGKLLPDEITDSFGVDLNEGEPTEYAVTMPEQYHAYYKADAAREHVFKVRFDIEY